MSIEELTRKSYGAFEPFTAMVYFVPEVAAHYKAIGLNRRQGYFCGRAAAMGQVPGQVVAATFYNFNPTLAISATGSGWKIAGPSQILEAKLAGVGEALQRLLAANEGEPDLLAGVERSLELTHRATADLSPIGRALFAGHQALAWPSEPLTALWHGINLLREYRGDGHITALIVEEIRPVESLLLQLAFAPRLPLALLQQTRAWSDDEMEAGRQSLAERGLLQDGVLTDKGRETRERIEQHTDRLDRAPFEALGETNTQELLTLIGGMSRRIRERGGLS